MVERSGSHKKLKGLSALGTSALFLVACSNGNETAPINTFAPDNTPNNSQVENTPEVEESPLEQSKRAALDIWLGAFNYNGINDQKEQKNFTASINVSSDNLDLWKNAQTDTVLNGQDSNETLRVSWEDLLILYNPDNQKQGSADKYVGNLEISNVNIIAQEYPFGISPADKASGIEWRGTVWINYAEHYSSLYYRGVDQPWADLTAQTWINQDPVDPMPEFSPWYNSKFVVELLLMSNGQWKTVQEDERTASDNNFKGLLNPSYYSNLDNASGICAESGFPCKLIKVTS